jgi:hypothetical protein
MDPAQIRERGIKKQIRSKLAEWKTDKRYYHVALWWERHINKQLKNLVCRGS